MHATGLCEISLVVGLNNLEADIVVGIGGLVASNFLAQQGHNSEVVAKRVDRHNRGADKQ